MRELLGRLQELDVLLELRNGFIRAADILVCNRNILGPDLDRFALADPKNATEPWACTAAHSSVREVPKAAQQCQRHKIFEQKSAYGVRWALEPVADLCIL